MLIIDDEADQASLNTQERKNNRKGTFDESAIFNSLKQLKDSLPNHSFIQYTATPLANLLIDQYNILSPKWHVILILEMIIQEVKSFLKIRVNM